MSEVKRYADRDIMQLDREGNYYCNHVLSMTREGLHDKSDIAAELAFRDSQIDRVTAERDAALGRVTELESSFDELAAAAGFSEARLDQTGDSPIDCAKQLQQLLTAADERADVLEGLLLQTNELLYAIQGDPGTVPSSSIDAMRGEVFTALKPAEGGGNE